MFFQHQQCLVSSKLEEKEKQKRENQIIEISDKYYTNTAPLYQSNSYHILCQNTPSLGHVPRSMALCNREKSGIASTIKYSLFPVGKQHPLVS